MEQFVKRDHILGHKTSLDKFKKNKFKQDVLSDYSETKLEITYKKIN